MRALLAGLTLGMLLAAPVAAADGAHALHELPEWLNTPVLVTGGMVVAALLAWALLLAMRKQP